MAHVPHHRKPNHNQPGQLPSVPDHLRNQIEWAMQSQREHAERRRASGSTPTAINVVIFVIAAIAVIAFSVFVAQHLVAGPH